MSAVQDMNVDRMIHLIYDAAENPSNWPDILYAFLELTGQPPASSGAPLAEVIRQEFSTESLIDTLLPHIERSLKLGLKLHQMSEQQLHVHAALDRLPLAIYLVDRSLVIGHRNQAAQNQTSKGGFLSESGGALFAPNQNDQRQIRAAVERAISCKESSSFSLKHVNGSETKVSLLVTPAGKSEDGIISNAAIFVAFRQADEVLPENLQALFGLSRAESELAKGLAKGLSLNEYAQVKGVSSNTLRTQLRAVFDKTGTHRQPDLVSLVLSSTATLKDATEVPEHLIQVPATSARSFSIELDDGRQLGYAEYGARNGRVVLFCHGLRGSRFERPPDAVLARLDSTRLIVLDRPGYGLSSSLNNHSFAAWPGDVMQLLRKLEIERFSVLGFSIGGAYALSLCAALPDRVRSLGLAASVTPLEAPIAPQAIRPGYRVFSSLARYAPKVLTNIIELMSTDIYRHPEKHIDRYVLRNCEFDIRLFQQPEVRRIYLQALAEAGRFGRQHIAEDMIAVTQSWGFSVADIRCPVRMWHGEQDPTVSIEQARSLAQALPDCEFTPLVNCGHFFLYGHWREILTTLTKA